MEKFNAFIEKKKLYYILLLVGGIHSIDQMIYLGVD